MENIENKTILYQTFFEDEMENNEYASMHINKKYNEAGMSML